MILQSPLLLSTYRFLPLPCKPVLRPRGKRPRVNFRAGSFDTMIDKHGYMLDIYKSKQCSCWNVITGQPDPNCSFCERGWQYYGCEKVKGIITSVEAEKQMAETGGILIGTMSLTVKAEVELSYHNRIVHRDSVFNFSELMIRGSGWVDYPRFKINEILRVLGADGKVFIPGVDYRIYRGGVRWIKDQPSEGDQYAVAYKTHPSWLTLTPVNLARDVYIKFRKPFPEHHRLPHKWMCKLEYLYQD